MSDGTDADGDWLAAVRSALESAPRNDGFRLDEITVSTEVIHLDEASVRPDRRPDGAWLIRRGDEVLAELPDDDTLVHLLGLEWANPVEVTPRDDPRPQRLWLFRGHWLLVHTPESADPDETRGQVSLLLRGLPGMAERAQQQRLNDLVALFPESPAQRLADVRRGAAMRVWGLIGVEPVFEPVGAGDFAIVSVCDLDEERADDAAPWVATVKKADGTRARVWAFSSEELAEAMVHQREYPQVVGTHRSSGEAYFAYNGHIVRGLLPPVAFEELSDLLVTARAYLLSDPAFAERGDHPSLRRPDTSDEAALDDVSGDAPTLSWAPSALASWRDLQLAGTPDPRHAEALEVVPIPDDRFDLIPLFGVGGRWALTVGLSADGVTPVSGDLPEIAQLADDQQHLPRAIGAVRQHVAWLFQGSGFLTTVPTGLEPCDQLATAAARILREHSGAVRPEAPPWMTEVLQTRPRSLAGHRERLKPARGEPGHPLWLAGEEEVNVTQVERGHRYWAIAFADGRFPRTSTVDSGHADGGIFQELSKSIGFFLDIRFGGLLDEQWHVPQPLAAAGNELLWMYRGWPVVSALPRSWTEFAQMRRGILFRLFKRDAYRFKRLREWRAVAAGTSLAPGIAAAVRARADHPHPDALAEEVDWIWSDAPPTPAPILRADRLPDDAVGVRHLEGGWSFVENRSGKPLVDRVYSDDKFVGLLDAAANYPVLLGTLKDDFVFLYRGHCVKLRSSRRFAVLSRLRTSWPLESSLLAHAAIASVLVEPSVAEPVDTAELEEARRLLTTVTPGLEPDRSRKHIPQRVRNEVWRRDGGRCVQCDSQERLEFDHVIPLSRGGSDTARNLQLLCESCNRKKAAMI